MLKFLMLLPLFILCMGFGLIYIVELLARKRQIEDMVSFLRYLRREIRCQRRPLVDLLGEYKSDLPLLLSMHASEPFDLVACYEKAKEDCRHEMFFNSADWHAADELFHILGNGDCASQEEGLRICEESFGHASIRLREKLARNGKPALVLGASMGAILVLLLL